MATYAPWNPSKAVDTNVLQTKNKNPLDRGVARLFRRSRSGMRSLAALMKALNGAEVGQTATVTRYRVEGDDVELRGNTAAGGGKRTIETVTKLNRATTSADKEYIDTLIDPKFVQDIDNRPVDKSGIDGGVGVPKLGF